MRRHLLALVIVGSAVPTAQLAHATQTCPTLRDAAGDTGAFGP